MINVIAILDAGKTNKKLFLFDEQYRIVWEQACTIDPVSDEDGDSCEDLPRLTLRGPTVNHWPQYAL